MSAVDLSDAGAGEGAPGVVRGVPAEVAWAWRGAERGAGAPSQNQRGQQVSPWNTVEPGGEGYYAPVQVPVEPVAAAAAAATAGEGEDSGGTRLPGVVSPGVSRGGMAVEGTLPAGALQSFPLELNSAQCKSLRPNLMPLRHSGMPISKADVIIGQRAGRRRRRVCTGTPVRYERTVRELVCDETLAGGEEAAESPGRSGGGELAHTGRAVQVDSIKSRVESACGLIA